MEEFAVSLLVHCYSGVLRLARLAAYPLIRKGARMHTLHIRERLRLPSARKDFRGRTIVWLHAASLGESKVLVEFLRVLHEKSPEHLYVVTAATASGVGFLEQFRHEAVCAAGYLPYDTVPLMNGMIERFNISRVWLIETELWPSMLWVCAQRAIPVGIANARMEQKSYATYKWFALLFRPLLRRMERVLVQDISYAKRFEAMGVARERIIVTGNFKSRVAIRRPSYDEWKRLRGDLNVSEDCTVITAGCIHGGEGSAIRSAAERIGEKYSSWKWIVVPRHLEEVPELLKSLGPEAVHVREPRISSDWRVCVVAKYGVMEDMYRVADVAVVGGTFVNVGGHNVWEAAQFGVPVLWGPSYHTQRESCERLLSAGVGFSVQNGDELADALMRILKTDAKRFIEAQRAFMENVGSSTQSLKRAIP